MIDHATAFKFSVIGDSSQNFFCADKIVLAQHLIIFCSQWWNACWSIKELIKPQISLKRFQLAYDYKNILVKLGTIKVHDILMSRESLILLQRLNSKDELPVFLDNLTG